MNISNSNIINSNFFYHILVLLVLLSTLSNAKNSEKSVINILTERPNNVEVPLWENKYEQLRNYILANSSIKDFDIKFSYDKELPETMYNTENYKNYVKFILRELQNSNYDMMILDSRFLFSDISFVESGMIKKTFDERRFIQRYFDILTFKNTFDGRKFHQFYLDLTDYIKEDDISFHNQEILKGGRLENKLYGLPFELDADLLYYQNTNETEASGNLSSSLEDVTWDKLLTLNDNSNSNKSYPLCLSLSDDDELLNLFVEYTHQSTKNFDAYYNKSSNKLFDSFRNFVFKALGSEEIKINDLLNNNQNLEDAYKKFIQKKECHYFKGKASHYPLFFPNNSTTTTSDNFSASLLPQNISILDKKYLVINNKSKIDKQKLLNIAYQLTSKEVQLFKAQQFGSIPTFNLDHLYNKDSSSNSSICSETPHICNILRKTNSIDIKKKFYDEKMSSAPFMEIRLLLPTDIKNLIFLKKDYSELASVFENIQKIAIYKNTNHDNNKITIYGLYIPMTIFTIGAVGIMILVYKHKEHPFLKIFSPSFCNLIIFAFIMNILSPIFMIKYHSIFKCKFKYVYETVDTSLIIIPMVAITYRIYSVYNNSSKLDVSKKLKNHHLFMFIVFSLSFLILLSTGAIHFFLNFYMISYGTINTYRQPSCGYDRGQICDVIKRVFFISLVIYMIVLIIKTGRISKRFGEFKYIYVMFLSLAVEYLKEFHVSKLANRSMFLIYILYFLLYMLVYIITIYILVGSRLIYVIRHPDSTDYYIYSGYSSTTTSVTNPNYLYKNYVNSKYLNAVNSHISNVHSESTKSKASTTIVNKNQNLFHRNIINPLSSRNDENNSHNETIHDNNIQPTYPKPCLSPRIKDNHNFFNYDDSNNIFKNSNNNNNDNNNINNNK